MAKYFSAPDKIEIPAHDSWLKSDHLFEPKSVLAVDAAIAAGRPLLLRGEPGIGKTQLARSVATVLEVPFLYRVVDERTERDDLLYHYDAVSRLAQAQVSGHLAAEGGDWREKLKESNFVRPGVLWWAFDWAGATSQAEIYTRECHAFQQPEPRLASCTNPYCSSVVLIDEIDKADPSVPNGLLESFGNKGFQADQIGKKISLKEGEPGPLVIVTTNEERELPAAFLRRCLVLIMEFPMTRDGVYQMIHDRVRLNYDSAIIEDRILNELVNSLLERRKQAEQHGVSKPGVSEALDLVKVLCGSYPGNPDEQENSLKLLEEFAFQKHDNSLF